MAICIHSPSRARSQLICARRFLSARAYRAQCSLRGDEKIASRLTEIPAWQSSVPTTSLSIATQNECGSLPSLRLWQQSHHPENSYSYPKNVCTLTPLQHMDGSPCNRWDQSSGAGTSKDGRITHSARSATLAALLCMSIYPPCAYWMQQSAGLTASGPPSLPNCGSPSSPKWSPGASSSTMSGGGWPHACICRQTHGHTYTLAETLKHAPLSWWGACLLHHT
jgi:hypothetical protein